ncbi:hypothetical protein J4G33_16775 [Actinotalea sp. BY-33]|uniref:PIN domain-containing protein n=1 Tax=Actinotalea soli TaxID=2819234 RepID=A0A939LST4_9CELL|nr:hypothetical protein [Actinotalea soli]MBO1753463.1 hypothetical protein [Actinotalea soli]
MLIYADGTALGRSLVPGPESASWMRWSHEHAAELVTSPVGLTDLSRTADGLDAVARAKAHEIATTIEVVRFFDQSLEAAAMASSVLSPFSAMELGVAVAHPEIDRVATYDPLLARVAVIYGLEVVSPGRAAGWWET